MELRLPNDASRKNLEARNKKTKKFAECPCKTLGKMVTLPSASIKTLSKLFTLPGVRIKH
jgi:hypothetical protein